MSENLNAELDKLRIDRGRKRPPHRGPWKLLFFALILIGGIAGFSLIKAQMPVPVEVVSPEVEVVKGSGTYPILTASGYVVPRDSISVSSKLIGRVKDIYVDRGDQVKAGDVLLRLEDDEQQAQLKLAEAQLTAAKARLAELEAGSRPEEVAAAAAAVESARATLTNTKQERDRLAQLRERNVSSQQEYDRALAAYAVALAQLNSEQKRYDLVKEGPRREVIDAARAAVGQAEANVLYAKTQLDYTVIKAPISGTILDKVAERGELLTNINVGTSTGVKSSAVSMANLKDLQIEIDLNESDLNKVHLQQSAEIRLDSAPDRVFMGKVDEIAPQADRQKGTVQVKVALLNPDETVRPEVNSRVTFLEKQTATSQSANDKRIWVPQAVIHTTPEGPTVFLVINGKAEQRNIRTGVSAEKGVLVRDGLNGNEQIIAAPTKDLKSSQSVKISKKG